MMSDSEMVDCMTACKKTSERIFKKVVESGKFKKIGKGVFMTLTKASHGGYRVAGYSIKTKNNYYAVVMYSFMNERYFDGVGRRFQTILSAGGIEALEMLKTVNEL